ncbi:MAG: hypothetical protein KKA79_03015 [Nanoarchaeota archaeon]|nr:hypothetical protein [Nanoarchaeota archaeon]MCG2717722.1 hypothetical protein [Nanoarchaeota archaeon]
MKILYISDVHAAVDNLNIVMEYTKENTPDMAVVSGDLVDFGFLKKGIGIHPETNQRILVRDIPIYEPYTLEKYQNLFGFLFDYAQRHEEGMQRLSNIYDMTRAVYIVAEKISQNPPEELSEDDIEQLKEFKLDREFDNIEDIVDYYLSIVDFAEGNMDIQYDCIKDILDRSGVNYHVLPGNYDKDIQETSLKDKDIHRKTLDKDGLIISCFGGANDFERGDIAIEGIPLEITVPFKEYVSRMRTTISEVFNFLIEEKPDIAFTHIPPRGNEMDIGLAKRDPPMQHPQTKQAMFKGSPGLTAYVKQGFTKLICCGHMHGGVGASNVKTEDGLAVVLNAGSLDHGYFTEINIDDETKEVDSINLYQIKPKIIQTDNSIDWKEELDINNVELLIKYVIRPDGNLERIKLAKSILEVNDQDMY